MKKLGIDVSRYQAGLDFKAAQEEGVSYVIIKAGGGDDGLYQDRCFERHYSECCEIGMDKGAYFFGKAYNAAQAAEEARYFVELLGGRTFEYPVFYDVEGDMLEAKNLTEIILAFLDTVRESGYEKAGLYSSEDPMNNRMNVAAIAAQGYYIWCAKYSRNEPVLRAGAAVALWQSGGEVNYLRTNQIAGQVCDQNYCYMDFSQPESGVAENYIRTRYVQYLNRDADAGGMDTFLSALSAGEPAALVDESLMNSEEYHREYVRKCYRIFLGREAAEDEVDIWLQLALCEICRGIYGSEEARIHRG